MRLCSTSAVRNLTFFTLVVLSSHSFVLVNAQSDSSTDSLSPTSSPSPTVSPVSPSPPTPTPAPASHSSSDQSSPSPTLPAADSSSSESKSSSSKTTPTATSVSATEESSSSSSSESSSSSSSSSSSPSSSSSSAPSSATLPSTSSDGTTLVAQPQNTHFSQYTYTHGTAPTSSGSAVPSETAVGAAAAGTSFSHNKGAVAAVATIASLIGASIIGFIAFKLIKRRSRLRDEEEDVYFEKYQDPDPPFHGSGGANDTSYNISSATQPAATDAYPDRSMHYGATQPAQDMYADPTQYGIQYPPGTAYAAAAHGAPYQYGGDNGSYGAAPTSANHPFSHPENNNRPAIAPRVPPFGQTGGVSYDEAYAQ
ncbi:hypothetical protein BDY19DRAFT_944247 [Irpex rosettiformis]|uniref:Uncharacterized protein n=1 Tax=Irpex rosettiformis TaxID=378272 RepID=A0ACB8U479_9APHY|nr:hypothetical protein BDY19DRAFT_944247 [Irpex rosettiformis]